MIAVPVLMQVRRRFCFHHVLLVVLGCACAVITADTAARTVLLLIWSKVRLMLTAWVQR
jgi:hypothetical protein